jgi:hypothetical protein
MFVQFIESFFANVFPESLGQMQFFIVVDASCSCNNRHLLSQIELLLVFTLFLHLSLLFFFDASHRFF